MSLTVSYTNLTDWSVEWGHSLYASPAYRQRQIAPNHAGLLFYDQGAIQKIKLSYKKLS